MSYKFLGLMDMNESEYLMANAVGSATIGWPDFNILIIDTLINGFSKLDSFIFYMLLLIKLIIALSSFYWIYKILQNIEFTYKRHTSNVFNNYLANLVLIGLVVFILATILRKIIF
ncbi:MAG: hypothetical protein AABY07_09930 [Nanoarchaeota archaeon]